MKIVFILSSAEDTHQINRVEEFINEGYDVEVYAFNRTNVVQSKNLGKFKITSIGSFANYDSYQSRIPIIYKGIKKVADLYKKEKDIVFFYQGLSVALFGFKLIKAPFIYEECDLLHVSISNKIVRKILDVFDKQIIKKSLLTIFTSEGFAQYHFGNDIPSNIHLVTNRLQESISSVPPLILRNVDMNNLQIAFVGSIRYDSVYNFVKVFLMKFPQHDFHLFGKYGSDEFKTFEEYPNFHYHGVFKNPDDLPHIYSQIDLILCTYDARGINERYAEPNKLYEAIYFEKPIIVSSGTFLAEKVKKLGIGYDVDALNGNEVIEFISKLEIEHLLEKSYNAHKIDKKYCINVNDEFFNILKLKLKSCHENS